MPPLLRTLRHQCAPRASSLCSASNSSAPWVLCYDIGPQLLCSMPSRGVTIRAMLSRIYHLVETFGSSSLRQSFAILVYQLYILCVFCNYLSHPSQDWTAKSMSLRRQRQIVALLSRVVVGYLILYKARPATSPFRPLSNHTSPKWWKR